MNHKIPAKAWVGTRVLIPLLAFICCFALRVAPLRGLDADNDEANYGAGVGLLYADYLKHGKIGKIIASRENYEHPPLVKLFYGAAIALTGRDKSPQSVIKICRLVSVIFTSLEAAVLSFISPLAAVFFSVHSWQVYYSSKVYLDGISSFFALCAVFFFLAARKEWNRKMMLSAVFLGAAMASKYINAVTGFVIFCFLLRAFNGRLKPAGRFLLISLAVFYVLDPIIWARPIANLKASLLFHNSLSENSPRYLQYLERFGRRPGPFTQFSWLWQNRGSYQPELLPFGWDRALLLLSFAGLPFLWLAEPMLAVWYAAGALFLVVYPVKYPHYTLAFIPAMALSVAEAIRSGVPWLALKIRSSWPFRFILESISEENLAAALMLAITFYAGWFACRHWNDRPEMVKAANSYADTMVRLGRTAEAAQMFHHEIGKTTEVDVAAHLNLANLLLTQNKFQEAQAEAQAALSLQPDYFAGRLILGNILMAEGKADEALKMYRSIDPNRIMDGRTRGTLFQAMGSANLTGGDLREGLRLLKQAAALKPDEAILQNQLGNAYFRSGDMQAAVQAFSAAIRLAPNDWSGHHNLAIAYSKLGRPAQAVAECEAALRINPSDRETAENLRRLKVILGK